MTTVKTLQSFWFAAFVVAPCFSAAQGQAPGAAPRPQPIAARGTVPREPAVEQRLRTDVKVPERLLVEQSALDAAALPLAGRAALDAALDAPIRGAVLSALAQSPETAGLPATAGLFAQLNPQPTAAATETPATDDAAGPVEAAWRRLVGDRRRLGELRSA